jgi:hypothetical protein
MSNFLDAHNEDQEVRPMPEPERWSEYIYGLGEDLWKELGGGEDFLEAERESWE